MSIIKETPRDRNFRSFDKEVDRVFSDHAYDPPRPQDWDDIVKISACRRCRWEYLKVRSIEPCQREDGIDISYLCDDIVIDHFAVDAGHKYAVTIKQARNVMLCNGLIGRPGGGWERVDIDLGNRSQYRRLRTEGVVIDNVRRRDGRPVRIRVGDSEPPTLRNGIYDVLTLQSWGLKGFVWACARIDARSKSTFQMLQWREITPAHYA